MSNIYSKKSYFNSKKIGYITSMLACASIPHSNIKNNSFFKRSNGKTTLKIISDPEYGLPYGLIPRLIMIWLCTEIKLTKSRNIYLGKNQNIFIKKLGLTSTGGKNGTIIRVKTQLLKLVHSIFSLTYENNSIHQFQNLLIVEQGILYWNKKNTLSKKLYWNNNIIISEKFFNAIKNTALPINLKIIQSIRSPLAIDIYIWLTWRLRIINKRETYITWTQLQLQFGSNYKMDAKGLSNFKLEFIKRLKDIHRLYPWC